MHYATHAVSPCLALVRGEAEQVSASALDGFPNLAARYGSSFAVESALFKVRNQQISFEVTRSLVRDGTAICRELRCLWRQSGIRMGAD